MKQTTFGKTGLQVSALGFGSASIGFLGVAQEEVHAIFDLLLGSGINLIDTAASYAGAEELIAPAIANRRQQCVLISKCGTAVSGVSGEPWSASLVAQSVDRSLRRLAVEQLDVMLLHSCDLATLQKGEALGALVKAREQGKVRFVGYSGDNEAAAWAAAQPEVAVIETSISICDQANIDTVLPVCQANNVAVLAKRSIANAAWKSREAQPGVFKDYAAKYSQRLALMNLKASDFDLPGVAEQVWAEVALRFTLSQSGVNSAVIGTTSPENIQANIRAAEKGPLPASIVNLIRQAFRRAEATAGEKWLGLT